MEAHFQTLGTLIVKEQRNKDQDQRLVSLVFCYLSAFKSHRTSVLDGATSNLLNFDRMTTGGRTYES